MPKIGNDHLNTVFEGESNFLFTGQISQCPLYTKVTYLRKAYWVMPTTQIRQDDENRTLAAEVYPFSYKCNYLYCGLIDPSNLV